MDIERLREFCLSLPCTTECFPFDDTTLVFKVEGKMFLFTGLEHDVPIVNMKCDPDLALDLRDAYEEVQPGFHCNKKYWNSIILRPSLKDELLCDWILHSYTEVVKKLTRAQCDRIKKLLEEWKRLNGK